MLQETLLAAWRGLGQFEERASVRTWLYKIATNRCLNALRDTGRRPAAAPSGQGLAPPPEPTRRTEPLRLQPYPDALLDDLPDNAPGPEARYEAKEAVALAFVAGLQRLPPRQRAVLVLRDVLGYPAAQAAGLLGVSEVSVNSALQRARATLADLPSSPEAEVDAGLLDRYVDAFQRYDMPALMKLLHDDAVMSMPPYSLWLQGSEDVVRFMLEPGPRTCSGSVLVPVPAGPVNGVAAWGQYKPDPAGGYTAWALQVHDACGGRFSRLTFFLDTARLFPEFGLAPRLG
jgi:RNA polymerase sigma-70 factor (ECF subfamily)